MLISGNMTECTAGKQSDNRKVSSMTENVMESCVQGCRKVLYLCERLRDEEKEKVPESLIKAFQVYAEEGNKPSTPIYVDLENIDSVLAALLQLVLYYCGETDRKGAISEIQENTDAKQRQEIKKILLLKKNFDDKLSGGVQ